MTIPQNWQTEDSKANYEEACRAIRNKEVGAMDIIYFCDSPDVVKIGFSQTSKRIADHERTGMVLRAVLPGRYEDEQALHKHFLPFHRGGTYGKEYYQPVEEVYEYIDCLLKQGFATPFEEDVKALPHLPFSVWKPGSAALVNSMNADAQYSLWVARTAKERVAYFSKTAHLNSITDEWYTPKEWIDLSREALGSIDLDPATTATVNRQFIQAPIFYTKDMNGLSQDLPWAGNVWLNPPYGRGDNSAASFLHRLVDELKSGTVKQAISCLNLNSMSSLWFSETVMLSKAIYCIPRRRVDYIPPNPEMKETSANKGTVFSYFGEQHARFAKIFGAHGEILRSY